MSIWCSWQTPGESDDGVLNGDVMEYLASHIYPDGDWTPMYVDLAHIAPWCVPGNRDYNEDEHGVGPWVRLSIKGAAVVLNEPAVRLIHEQLTEWLDRPKVYPA